jgi:hypothetical protein
MVLVFVWGYYFRLVINKIFIEVGITPNPKSTSRLRFRFVSVTIIKQSRGQSSLGLVLLLLVRQRDNSIATTLATIFLFIFFKQGGDKTKIHRTAWPCEAKLFPIPWPSA